MTEIFRPPFFQPDSINGVPLAGALLYFYAAGTATPITVYQDSGLITPHASPVVADASGIFPAIYVNTTTYKIVLQTSAGVTVKTYDNINTTSSSNTVLDSTFIIQNASDQTKQAQFSVASISSGATRVFTFPDSGGTIQVSSSNNLTNAPFFNLSLVASVAANALTIAIKGVDGNDPSSSNNVLVSFRSATAASGSVSLLTIATATSLVISSGSTLGTVNNVAATLAIVGFNDGGTFRLGIINPTLLPLIDSIASSTAEGGAGTADSAGVFYTGTAVTSKAYTVLGFVTITEATAGTWASSATTTQVGNSAAVNDAFSSQGTWTPVDASGTALSFTGVTGQYTKIGHFVMASFRVTYPATADTAAATIGGLPFTSASIGVQYGAGTALSGASSPNGLLATYLNTNAKTFAFINNAGSGPLNSAFSGVVITGMLTYVSA